jgi:hypothetical protein
MVGAAEVEVWAFCKALPTNKLLRTEESGAAVAVAEQLPKKQPGWPQYLENVPPNPRRTFRYSHRTK